MKDITAYNRIKKRESRLRQKDKGMIHLAVWIKKENEKQILDFIRGMSGKP